MKQLTSCMILSQIFFSLQNVPLKKLDRVLKDVAKNFQINISQEILKEFEMLVNESVQSETFVQPNVNKTYLKAKIVSFFEATDAKNGTDYSDDTNFVDGLVTHLVFLLERIDKKKLFTKTRYYLNFASGIRSFLIWSSSFLSSLKRY
ncbi:hypothetical protein [Lacticaseibacillus thailandensis]|uniref:hypothetical protein n=1 Tax=Lacticaseibacillus thailandensis TaxID=381741 RepID=UPI0012E26FD0|nr:hypothetical protein [Lacticaseibacillus thailandensis]